MHVLVRTVARAVARTSPAARDTDTDQLCRFGFMNSNASITRFADLTDARAEACNDSLAPLIY